MTDWYDCKKKIPPRCEDDPEGYTEYVIVYWDSIKSYSIGCFCIDDCATDISDDKRILLHGWGHWMTDCQCDSEPSHWTPLPLPPYDEKVCMDAHWSSRHKRDGIYVESIEGKSKAKRVSFCPVCGES